MLYHCATFTLFLWASWSILLSLKHMTFDIRAKYWGPSFKTIKLVRESHRATTQLIKEYSHILYQIKGPILYCFSSISHSCQRSNSSVFDMHCPKPICGPEFSCLKVALQSSIQSSLFLCLHLLDSNELRLSTPTWRALPATSFSGRGFPLH